MAYVIGCNRVGSGNGLPYSGDSRIIDPLGEILASAAQTRDASCSPTSAAERVAEVRDRFRFLQDALGDSATWSCRATVPDLMLGCWRRAWIEFADGTLDDTTHGRVAADTSR